MLVINEMSARPDKETLMTQLLANDAEAWSSLRGLMAMLALPPIHQPGGGARKRPVEVEIAPGVWQVVDSMAIEEHRIRFWHTNGVRTEFVFLRMGNTIPRWRIEPQSTGVLAP